MTSGGDPFSILNRNPLGSGWKRPQPKAKVNMYRPGKEPKLQGKNDDDESDDNVFSDTDNKTEISKFTKNTVTNTVLNEDKSNLRSTVIKHNNSITSNSVAQPEESIQHLDVKEKELIVGEVEVVERKRRKAVFAEDETKKDAADREGDDGLGKRKREEDVASSVIQKSFQDMNDGVNNEDDEEGEEEEEDENDDEDRSRIRIARPVYIRNVIREDDRKMQEDEEWVNKEKEKVKRSMEERNKMLVIEAKKEREDLVEDNMSESDRDLPNDSDEEEAVAYERWKVRELKRIKREREESEKLFKEKETVEKRRMMTDEERAADDKRVGKYKEEQKSNYRFMQKYYDVGIYNIDENDPLFKRDYNMAVGEDLFDKSVLPTIHQKRRGEEHKRGKSKHTHLVAEDTTNFDPEYLPYEDITNKQKSMQAGYKNANLFDRPALRKLK